MGSIRMAARPRFSQETKDFLLLQFCDSVMEREIVEMLRYFCQCRLHGFFDFGERGYPVIKVDKQDVNCLFRGYRIVKYTFVAAESFACEAFQMVPVNGTFEFLFTDTDGYPGRIITFA